jgi:hypothetical protein
MNLGLAMKNQMEGMTNYCHRNPFFHIRGHHRLKMLFLEETFLGGMKIKELSQKG